MVPVNYKLNVNPNIQAGTFKGKNLITIDVLEPTEIITMHSVDLDIKDISIINSTTFVLKHKFDLGQEFLKIELNEKIQIGEFKLQITFEGKMRGKMVGLYSSSYIKEDGSKKYVCMCKFRRFSEFLKD